MWGKQLEIMRSKFHDQDFQLLVNLPPVISCLPPKFSSSTTSTSLQTPRGQKNGNQEWGEPQIQVFLSNYFGLSYQVIFARLSHFHPLETCSSSTLTRNIVNVFGEMESETMHCYLWRGKKSILSKIIVFVDIFWVHAINIINILPISPPIS